MTSHKVLDYFFIISGMFVIFSFYALNAATQDDIIVNHIKSRSNLTDADISRWKFLWLKSFAEPVIGTIGTVATYKAGSLAQAIPTTHDQLITNVFQGQYMPQFLKYAEPLAKNEWMWAGVGVVGVGLAAYKLLYPRVQMGMVARIQQYDTVCKNLAIADKQYNTKMEFEEALKQPGNALWQHGTAIARDKGFENLIHQASVAQALLDQLLSSGGNFNTEHMFELRSRIQAYKQYLTYNQQWIAAAVNFEKGERIAQGAWKGVQYLGGLLVAGAAATVAAKQIKNVRMQWDLAKDIAKEGKDFVDYGWPWLLDLFGFGPGKKEAESSVTNG